MQISDTSINQKNPAFRNAFYNMTSELNGNIIASRAVVDMFGCDIPWIIMASNNQERKEKARKFFFIFAIA